MNKQPTFKENTRSHTWLYYTSRRHLYDGWYLCLPADTQGNPRLMILIHESELISGKDRVTTYDVMLPEAIN